MVDLDKCRMAFEAWMEKEKGIRCGGLRTTDRYIDPTITRAWWAWKAGALWQNEATVKGS